MKRAYPNFVSLILLGIGMSAMVLMKIFGGYDIDSDWFWFLTGLGLMVQGIISSRQRKKFGLK